MGFSDGAVKEDVCTHVMSVVRSVRVVRMREMFTWTCSIVLYKRVEVIGVIHIETVGDCKAEYG